MVVGLLSPPSEPVALAPKLAEPPDFYCIDYIDCFIGVFGGFCAGASWVRPEMLPPEFYDDVITFSVAAVPSLPFLENELGLMATL